MENACVLCIDLAFHKRPHPALQTLPTTAEPLSQCRCCQSLLRQQQGEWELIWYETPGTYPMYLARQ